MIPRKYEPLLFGLLLSGLMSFIVSGISTLKAVGPGPGFIMLWTASWLTAWLVAFPVVLVAAPLARRAVQGLLQQSK